MNQVAGARSGSGNAASTVECASVNTTSVQGASRCCAELANEPLGKLAANGQVAFVLKLCDRPLGIWVNCSSWPDLAIAEFAQCALHG